MSPSVLGGCLPLQTSWAQGKSRCVRQQKTNVVEVHSTYLVTLEVQPSAFPRLPVHSPDQLLSRSFSSTASWPGVSCQGTAGHRHLSLGGLQGFSCWWNLEPFSSFRMPGPPHSPVPEFPTRAQGSFGGSILGTEGTEGAEGGTRFHQ